MNSITAFFHTTGEILQLLMESIFWCKAALSNRDKIFRQMLEIGNQTLPVAALISLFIGGVLAGLFGYKSDPYKKTIKLFYIPINISSQENTTEEEVRKDE